jgi:pimeloyl-ACP methyl ester carboxylesterase
MKHLLLLHGAIGAKDQLQPLAELLKTDYHVHTLNFDGHGGAAMPAEPFSIPLFAKNVNDYCNAAGITNTDIFGYSMGGYVAMYVANRSPALVNKIITLATKFHWDEPIAAKETKMLDAGVIAQKVPAFATQLEQRHAPNDWIQVLDKTKEMLLQLGKQNTLQLNDYAAIQTPSLIMLGDKEKMVTAEETLAVYRTLPAAQLCILPNTPHPLEQVDAGLLSYHTTRFLA